MKLLLSIAATADGHGSKELGQLLRARRKEAGLSLRELSTLSETGVRFLGELERGKPNVDLHLVLRVLSTLGLTLAVTEQEK